MDLLDAVCEARGAGLEGVGGLDLEDAVVANGAPAAPARPGAARGRVHFLAAPGREEDPWRASGGFGGIDNAILREAGVGELRKNRRAAGDLNQFLDPTEAGDQRVVPFLEEDAESGRECGGCFANLIQSGFE